MARNPYEILGVPKNAGRRRDQEGVPQARARVPPRPQSRRRGRRGALQGGAGRVRRALRRREAEGVRHVRRGGAPRVPRRCGGHGRARFEEFDLVEPRRPARRDVRRRAAAAREPRSRSAATISRHTSGSRSRTRSRACRSAFRSRPRPRARSVTAPARSPERPGHLPAVRGTRRRVRFAGPLRVLAAVPALPRQRDDRREAVQATAAGAAVSGRRSGTR